MLKVERKEGWKERPKRTKYKGKVTEMTEEVQRNAGKKVREKGCRNEGKSEGT